MLMSSLSQPAAVHGGEANPGDTGGSNNVLTAEIADTDVSEDFDLDDFEKMMAEYR